MDDLCGFNLRPSNVQPKQSTKICNIHVFVTDAVDNEINNCNMVRSKALLSKIKRPLIEYLKNEFFKAPTEDFVDRICAFENLEKTYVAEFKKAFPVLEKIATQMEESRKNIRSPMEQAKCDEIIERLTNRKRYNPEEHAPESPPRNIRHDPRQCKKKYSPPKSVFDTIQPTQSVKVNDSVSYGHSQKFSTSKSRENEFSTFNIRDKSVFPMNPSPPQPLTSRNSLKSRMRARSPLFYRQAVASLNASINASTLNSGDSDDEEYDSRQFYPEQYADILEDE